MEQEDDPVRLLIALPRPHANSLFVQATSPLVHLMADLSCNTKPGFSKRHQRRHAGFQVSEKKGHFRSLCLAVVDSAIGIADWPKLIG